MRAMRAMRTVMCHLSGDDDVLTILDRVELGERKVHVL